jgi:hypothetical protein
MPKGDRLIVSGPPPPQTDTPSAFSFDPDAQAYEDQLETRRAQDEEIKARREGAAAQERDQQRALRESEEGRAGVTQAMAQRRRDAAAYPEQRKPTDPPNPEDYQKLSWGYLGSMVALGAFAGLAIRNAGNAPLNAFAGAAKGWNEGNMTAYKNATAEWEQKNRQLLEINRQQLEKYQTIMRNDDLNIDDKMNMMQMAAAENRDRIMYDQSKAKNFNGIAQALAMREQTTRQAEDHSQKMVDLLTQHNASAQSNADRMRAFFATPQGDQWFRAHPATQQMQMSGFLDTYPAQEMQTEEPRTVGAGAMQTQGAATAMPPDLRGPQPLNMKRDDAQYRQLRIKAWQQHGSEPTPQEYSAWQRQMHPARSVAGMEIENENARREAAGEPPLTKDEEIEIEASRRYATSAMGVAGTQAGRVAGGVEAFTNAVPLARQASVDVPRGNYKPLITWGNKWREMRSDPTYGKFVAANETLISDYAYLMGRGGAITVHARERAEGVLSTATSDEKYQAVIDNLEDEAAAVSKAPAQTKARLLKQLFPKATDAEVKEAASERHARPQPTQAPAAAGSTDDGFGQNVRVH